MDKKNQEKTKDSGTKKRRTIAVATLLALLIALLLFQLVKPKPSVAAYCKVYKEEKVRLSKLPGDTWPSGVFNEELSDAGEFAASFGKLEKVAPGDVKPDVATLRGLYQKIHDDPSQAIAASLSGVSADDSVKAWTKNHCDM